MLKSKKHVFWEALIISIVIFLAGLFVGMLVETANSSKISDLYVASEISLTDVSTVSSMFGDKGMSCDEIKQNNIVIADRVYGEAKLLEMYEASGKLTDSMKLLHKKYDLLRAILWISNTESVERCENYNVIVYLYEYDTEDLEKKATQNVWSKILLDVKSENYDVLLLPIAGDQNLTTISYLMDEYGVESLPAIVVNNENVIYELDSAEPVLEMLN